MKSRTTGYNLFCKELSCEEGVKLLDSKQRFVAYATRWAELTPEGRSEFKKRAANKNLSLTIKQKKVKWAKCLHKMLKILDEMQSYKTTSGYFVVKPQDGPPRYGGTPDGNNFIENEHEIVISGFCKGLDTQATTTTKTVTVNDIRQLFNCKYAEAVGQPGKRMPYKSIVVCMEGLPEGISLRKPQCYGTAQLRKIWNARANIRCVLE